MPKYGFPVARLFPYKDRIENSVLARETMGMKTSNTTNFVNVKTPV